MPKAISFIIIVLAFLFSSCSSDNNGKSKTVEARKVPVSQIWDGSDALQGQDYGVIKMPEKIEKVNSDGIYSFYMTPKSYDEAAASKRFFKAFFKDKYSEDAVVCEDDGKRYLYNDNGVIHAVFANGMPINAILDREDAKTLIGRDTLEVYSADKDKNVELELSDGKYTVGEICESAEKFIKEGLYPLYGDDDYVVRPYSVLQIRTAENDTLKLAEVHLAFSYKGIMLEDKHSELFESNYLNGYQTITYYTPFYLDIELRGKDNYTKYFGGSLPFDIHSEPLTELVGLKDAAELLKNELALNSRYEFSNVTLKYCSKQTTVDGSNLTYEERVKAAEALKEYNSNIEPTWCFEWKGYDANGVHNCAIKVNAVTGEITIDAIPTELRPSPGGSTTTAVTTAPEPEVRKPQSITADVVSYDGKTLTYTFEGINTSLSVPPEKFEAYIKGLSHTSTQIINNKYGIKVKCKLDFDENGELVRTDVKSLNGKNIQETFGHQPPKDWEEEHPKQVFGEAKAVRIKGSVYEVSNEFGKVQIDFNDLSLHQKAKYPDEIDRVTFTAFQFESGETVLTMFAYYDESSFAGEVIQGKVLNRDNLPLFAGTIQSISEDRATVLLADGKTTCDVPTYYNDGELKEGQSVMLGLGEDAGLELYGSGEQYKADYAVFVSHPEIYIDNYNAAKHGKIAYALRDEYNSVLYHIVSADEIKQK